MRGATILATLERLCVLASFSRPRVSDYHPLSEALFRTAKNRPDLPRKPFADLAQASAQVVAIVPKYNHEHRHSGIRLVAPAQRHDGHDVAIRAERVLVDAEAKEERPTR
jgi:transposase InsO family protein